MSYITKPKEELDDGYALLMKFGTEKNLKKLRSGQLYMKNIQYYVDLENETKNMSAGDRFDGQLFLEKLKITMHDPEIGKGIQMPDTVAMSLDLGYLKCPVFCMFMLDYRNKTDELKIGEITKCTYRLTDETIRKMSEFGEQVLIIRDPGEFFNRIEEALHNARYGYKRQRVSYYNNGGIPINEIVSDKRLIAFWKREQYSYQQEYRILVDKIVEDHLCIDIGDLSEYTEIVSTSDLMKMFAQSKGYVFYR